MYPPLSIACLTYSNSYFHLHLKMHLLPANFDMGFHWTLAFDGRTFLDISNYLHANLPPSSLEVIHNFQKKDIIAFDLWPPHPPMPPPPPSPPIGSCNFQTRLVLAPSNGDGHCDAFWPGPKASWPGWASSLGPRNLTDTFTLMVSFLFRTPIWFIRAYLLRRQRNAFFHVVHFFDVFLK